MKLLTGCALISLHFRSRSLALLGPDNGSCFSARKLFQIDKLFICKYFYTHSGTISATAAKLKQHVLLLRPRLQVSQANSDRTPEPVHSTLNMCFVRFVCSYNTSHVTLRYFPLVFQQYRATSTAVVVIYVSVVLVRQCPPHGSCTSIEKQELR